MAKLSFSFFIKALTLYAGIEKRSKELSADGNLSTGDLLMLLAEFGEQIDELLKSV